MRRRIRRTAAALVLVVAVPAATVLAGLVPGRMAAAPILLCSRAPASTPVTAFDAIPWQYPNGSEVVALTPPGGASVRVLSHGFDAAGAPAISADGRAAAFTGRRAASDRWRIWLTTPGGRRPRALTPATHDCTAPLFLADGRVLASCAEAGGAWNLFAFDSQSGAPEQLTFGAVRDGPGTLLADGRILFVRQRLDTADSCQHGRATLMTIRPDGTGLELFYGDTAHPARAAAPAETRDGRFWFVEDDAASPRLAVVDGRNPLDTFRRAGEVRGVGGLSPAGDGSIVAGVRDEVTGRVRLVRISPGDPVSAQPLVADASWHYFESAAPSAIAARRLTSVVDRKATTGRLLCLDVRDSDLAALFAADAAGTLRVRVLRATDGKSLGDVPIEADGSFYVEVPSDTPLLLELLTPTGARLIQTHAPLWVRPNETRGCIGCHESRTLAPRNRAPLAVRRGPVLLAGSKVALPEGIAP